MDLYSDASESDTESQSREVVAKNCCVNAAASPWIRIVNLQGHTFYRHVPTGETTWELPMNAVQPMNSSHNNTVVDHFVASEWRMYEDEYGHTYYYNRRNKESKWRIPCTLLETTQSGQRDREALNQWKKQMTGAGWGPWLKSKTSKVLDAVGGVGTAVRRLSTFAYRKAADTVSGWVSSTTDDEDAPRERWSDAESPLPFDRGKSARPTNAGAYVQPKRRARLRRSLSLGNSRSTAAHRFTHRPHPVSFTRTLRPRNGAQENLTVDSPSARPPLHVSTPPPPPDTMAQPPFIHTMRGTDVSPETSVLRPLVLPWAPPASEHRDGGSPITPVHGREHTVALSPSDTPPAHYNYSSSVHSDSGHGNWSSAAAEEV